MKFYRDFIVVGWCLYENRGGKPSRKTLSRKQLKRLKESEKKKQIAEDTLKKLRIKLHRYSISENAREKFVLKEEMMEIAIQYESLTGIKLIKRKGHKKISRNERQGAKNKNCSRQYFQATKVENKLVQASEESELEMLCNFHDCTAPATKDGYCLYHYNMMNDIPM